MAAGSWYKPGGEPRRAAVLPRGLVFGPALNSNWAGDPISGLGKLAQRSPLGFSFVPTRYGVGPNIWFSFHNYRIPRAGETGPRTREMLVLTGAAVGAKQLCDEQTFWSFSITAGARFQLQQWDGATYRTVTGTTVVQANTLYHLAYVNSGVPGANTLSLYVNGSLDGSLVIGDAQWPSPATLTLGSDTGGNNEVILMASAANAAWTAAEVRARYLDPYSHLEWDAVPFTSLALWRRAVNAVKAFIFRR